MKSIVAMLLGALLCVQPVYAVQVKEPILYTDEQKKETQRSEGGNQKEKETKETVGQGETEGQEETDAGETGEAQEGEAAQGEADAGERDEDKEDSEASENSGAQGQVEVSAPSAVLMESSTGQVIFEKDGDTQRPPASVTKVMTLLLIFDALADGKIKLEDSVTTSEYAASMGGSQVFLEPGEVQTVDTMIKCISVASANDACVAFKNSRRCTNEGKSAILYIEENG